MKITKKNLFIVNSLPVDISISLDKGLYLLTGENGIGKTSFYNFIKENKSDLGVRGEIAFMDQFPLTPINDVRLSDVVTFFKKGQREFDFDLAYKMLERYALSYLLERPLCLYSGGENQVVKFILMYCQNVHYYFLDEPLQYVDQKRVQQMKEDLSSLSKEKSVLIIEHRGEYLEDLKPKRIQMINNNKRVELYGY